MGKIKRRIRQKRWLKILLGLGIIGLLFLHFYVPRFITEIRNPILGLIRKAPEIALDKQYPGVPIMITSFDEVELVGHLERTPVDSAKGCILLIHGIGGYKEHFKALTAQLNSWGYHTLAIDQRAHGASGGKHCTFGAKEKKDIYSWVRYLQQQEKMEVPIGVWGQSLGGAVALQSLGTYPDIQFGIIESTFSNYQEVVHDYFKYHAGFNWRPFSNYLSDRAGRIAGFEARSNNPIDYAQKIHQPILVVHGTVDQRISIDYGRENFEAMPSLNKQFLEIKNAHHLNVWSVGGTDYLGQVHRFLTNLENH
ncbi:MAG: alpha/beta fold hydrolase [Bacteroidota bacterium]